MAFSRYKFLLLNAGLLARLPLSQVTELLSQAYAKAGRYDNTYLYGRRARVLADMVRAAQQFAALATTEARFRTREQAGQICPLTEQKRQQALRTSVAGGAGLFGLALLATGLAWRATRHLNRRLVTQSALLQTQATQLGELDKAKNQFFTNISHELRTPLLRSCWGRLQAYLLLRLAPGLYVVQ